jgi:uncharacterized protein YxeA
MKTCKPLRIFNDVGMKRVLAVVVAVTVVVVMAMRVVHRVARNSRLQFCRLNDNIKGSFENAVDMFHSWNYHVQNIYTSDKILKAQFSSNMIFNISFEGLSPRVWR